MESLYLTVGAILALVATLFRRFAGGPGVLGPESDIETIATYLLKIINRKLGKVLRGDRAQNVVVQLGIGGTGKTTLIKYLTHDLSANPTVETAGFNVYKQDFSITRTRSGGEVSKVKTSLVIADYRGQHYGTLIEGILNHTVERRSEVRNGDINTILFIVDVFYPNLDRSDDVRPQPMPDPNRLRENVEYWNEARLEVLFRLLRQGSVKNVGVFVNKCDLLTSEEGREEARRAIEPLVSSIRRWSDALGIEPFVVLGSLKTGTGVNELLDRMIRSAVYTSH
jgi:GTPase SAR1 family protein